MYLSNQAVVKVLCSVRFALVVIAGCDCFGPNTKFVYESFSSTSLKHILIAELMMFKIRDSIAVCE